MSYTALYRKFRPGTFEDVKGQEHIVNTLKNQIKANRLGHAYLFTGTRGTGKTSVAKLLAKVVNCESPIDGSPCNSCHMCKGIANQTSMNVIEIDAASNNGVDNVREIVEEVRYSPTEGKYKVYIIDEVHMLSTGAFNALLKTIEEPPSYVIFILATTEVHKIPVTILSRCQRYDFRRINIDTITNLLMDLMEKEQIEVEEKALRYVARVADGSLRDAESLLDQCISFYLGKKITYDNVLEVLGAVDTGVFSEMLHLLLEQDVAACIYLLEKIENGGRELGQFIIDFIWYLRNLLLMKNSGQATELIIEVSTENLMLLQQESQKVGEEELMRYIRVLSELSNQIRYATRKRVLVEITLIKLCKPEMEQNFDSVLGRLKALEKKLEQGIVVQSQGVAATQGKEAAQEPKKATILPDALPEDVKLVASNWRDIVHQISKKSPAMASLLQNATLSIEGEKTLAIVVTNSLDKDFIDREGHMQIIKETMESKANKQVHVVTRYLDKSRERIEDVPDLSQLIKMPIQYED